MVAKQQKDENRDKSIEGFEKSNKNRKLLA